MSDLLGSLSRADGVGTVVMRQVHRTDVEDLWDAVTSPERLARWLGATSGDLCAGGEYRVLFDDADEDQRATGVIEVCEPPRRLEATWQVPGEPAGRVVVTLEPVAGGTELTLTPTGLAYGVGGGGDVGYAAGWQVHLEQLTADLAGAESPDFWGRWEGLRDAYAERLGG